MPNPSTPHEQPTSLEIRLNSVNDAKAAMQNIAEIQRLKDQNRLQSVTFILAREHAQQIQATVGTHFGRLNPKWVTMQCPPHRMLYVPPAYVDVAALNAEVDKRVRNALKTAQGPAVETSPDEEQEWPANEPEGPVEASADPEPVSAPPEPPKAPLKRVKASQSRKPAPAPAEPTPPEDPWG